MTNKERLGVLLEGGVPDAPPHWELVFQIPETMFGMDPAALDAPYPSETARDEAYARFYVEVCERLLDECGWAALPPRNSYSPEGVREMKAALGDYAMIPGFEGNGVFWMLPGSEIMEFSVRLFEDMPGLLKEARAKCDQAKALLRSMADAGADFFVLTYDFGFNDAPFISPDHFAVLCAPFLAELVEQSHDLGKKVILHSDSCLTEILDQIHATGVDGYQSVDPQGHMDIRVVREQHPDWLLMGNVPCNLLQSDKYEDIRAAVRECVTHGGIGKPYIFSTSNCIFHGMPPESYRTMLDEYRKIIGQTS